MEINSANRAVRAITARQAPAESSRLARSSAATGAARSFFVASYMGTVKGVNVRALDARGGVVAAQAVPTQ